MARLTGHDAPLTGLLPPVTLELTDEELDAVSPWRGAATRGFEAEPFGAGVWVQWRCPATSTIRCVRCPEQWRIWLAVDLAGWASPLERFAATYVRRAAIRQGALEPVEMRGAAGAADDRAVARARRPRQSDGAACSCARGTERRLGRR
jgi:hypothetical protein